MENNKIPQCINDKINTRVLQKKNIFSTSYYFLYFCRVVVNDNVGK